MKSAAYQNIDFEILDKIEGEITQNYCGDFFCQESHVAEICTLRYCAQPGRSNGNYDVIKVYTAPYPPPLHDSVLSCIVIFQVVSQSARAKHQQKCLDTEALGVPWGPTLAEMKV